MARKKKKKQEKRTEKPSVLVTDLTRLDGQLRDKNLSKSAAISQGLVCYYCVFVNDKLASSPWMKLETGDCITVYPDDRTKISWEVGDEENVTTYIAPNNIRIRPIIHNSSGRSSESDLLESLGWD